MAKRKLLWVGDAGCPSGFARSTHGVCDYLHASGQWDITVLGINYRGDPHEYPYPIYSAMAGGDFLGVGRLVWMLDKFKPDVVVLQNDPWNIPYYIEQARQFDEYKDIKFVGFVAVDGKNCRGAGMNGLELGIFWTQFGLDEARLGGYTQPGMVIPLGVDLTNYTPMDQRLARAQRGFQQEHMDLFIVGNANRNQPRKRYDLTIKYFAEWIKSRGIDDASLYLHVAPTGDRGVDCVQLAYYYGLKNKLIFMQPEVFYGLTEAQMRATYCSWDVMLNTTQGEGFGLTAFEAMACGVPCILPDWSALGELCKDAAYMVPCTSTEITPPVNAIGGVMDEKLAIEALDRLYNDRQLRSDYSKLGQQRAAEGRFRWENVGEMFRNALDVV